MHILSQKIILSTVFQFPRRPVDGFIYQGNFVLIQSGKSYPQVFFFQNHDADTVAGQ
jgi:hypothetical protein